MNNIEILEELKARLKLYKKSTDVQFTFTKSDIQAIENLIQESKELKENQIWSEATIEGLKKDFVPTAKIKEIIDKIDAEDYYCLNEAEEDLRKLVE